MLSVPVTLFMRLRPPADTLTAKLLLRVTVLKMGTIWGTDGVAIKQ
jgi:hypothetical protein